MVWHVTAAATEFFGAIGLSCLVGVLALVLFLIFWGDR